MEWNALTVSATDQVLGVFFFALCAAYLLIACLLFVFSDIFLKEAEPLVLTKQEEVYNPTLFITMRHRDADGREGHTELDLADLEPRRPTSNNNGRAPAIEMQGDCSIHLSGRAICLLLFAPDYSGAGPRITGRQRNNV